MNYQEYLASREWGLLKEQVRKRSGGTCERCGEAPHSHTHHLTYERVGRERLGDLLGVCRPCHEYLSGRSHDDPLDGTGRPVVIVYAIPPIDHWDGWRKPEDLWQVECADDGVPRAPARWRVFWFWARTLARRLGWEGDIREGPFVSVLPPPSDAYAASPFVVAWKQDNNGTTFIATPFELPWIASDSNTRSERSS